MRFIHHDYKLETCDAQQCVEMRVPRLVLLQRVKKLNDVSIVGGLCVASISIAVRLTFGFAASIANKHSSACTCSENVVSIGSRLCTASIRI